MPYVEDLAARHRHGGDSRLRGCQLGVDPLGGAALHYWEPITDVYGLDITVTNPAIDPTFSFMTLDHDGEIRMDCSSPYAMASLVELKDRFDVAFGNDPDSDRHGIVTPSRRADEPQPLPGRRDRLSADPSARLAGAGRGRQDPGQQQHDRPGRAEAGPPLSEVPVGFKWFAPGLFDGDLLLRRRGECRRQLPAPRRHGLDDRQGRPDHGPAGRRDPRPHRQGSGRALPGADRGIRHAVLYADRCAGDARAEGQAAKAVAADVKASDLAGEPIVQKLTRAPGNDAPIGGLKVVTANGWFAARPSGTENIYKIYAESFRDEAHLETLVNEAQQIVQEV